MADTELSNNARKASAYVNLTLATGGGRLWPDDRRILEQAVGILNKLTK